VAFRTGTSRNYETVIGPKRREVEEVTALPHHIVKELQLTAKQCGEVVAAYMALPSAEDRRRAAGLLIEEWRKRRGASVCLQCGSAKSKATGHGKGVCPSPSPWWLP
jgi:hypothetical protein